MVHERNYVTEKRYKNLDSLQNNLTHNTASYSNIDYRQQSRLSAVERKTVNDLNNPLLTEVMNKGDYQSSRHNYLKEAKAHRFVQEKLKDMGKSHNDDDSLDSYAYNSAIVHQSELVEKGQKLGLKFNEMFRLDINNNPDYSKKERKYNYEWIVPDEIIPTYGLYSNTSNNSNNYQNNNYQNNNYQNNNYQNNNYQNNNYQNNNCRSGGNQNKYSSSNKNIDRTEQFLNDPVNQKCYMALQRHFY